MNQTKLTCSVLALLFVILSSSQVHADIATYPLTNGGSGNAPPVEDQAQEQIGPTPTQQAEVPENTNYQDAVDTEFESKQLSTCSMKYKLKGFSLAYKQYDGIGQIKCRNGQSAQVSLSSKSIGFTIGKSEIEGEGHFSDVKDISEIYGHYASLGNHFGFLKSVDQQVLTRGEISLVLRGKGRGIDIGFTIGDLYIGKR